MMTRSAGRYVFATAVIVAILATERGTLFPSLYAHPVSRGSHDSKVLAHRLVAIEEKNPYRLRELIHNGRLTLIAFIDHQCHTCLRSVEPIEELKRGFLNRADIVVVNPARITAAHSWAKDRYGVWFVPKFIILDRKGEVAAEYLGPTPSKTLASELKSLMIGSRSTGNKTRVTK